MVDQEYLLDDDAMRNFIINGYVKVQTDFPAAFHENVYQQIEDMFETHGNLGNNILPLIPEIQEVLSHPVVHGAMTSVLGPNYVLHPHRYCHFNRPQSDGQGFHKDSYEGDEQIRRHRCRWTMAFYYPQDTTEDMGPTAVLPASQYYDTHESAHAQPELPLCGTAGTVTIVHYDLWHRAMANLSDKKRHMVKFLFLRLDEPTHPFWNNADPNWKQPASGAFSDKHEHVWKQLWNWYRGGSNGTGNGAGSSNDSEVSALIEALDADDENVRLNAAYAFGDSGASAVAPLIRALHSDSDDVRRHATFALGTMGASPVPALIDALAEDNESIRSSAAYAFADIGQPARDAVPQLTQALRDESEWVRRHAAEALGVIGQSMVEEGDDSFLSTHSVPALVDLLGDDHYWIRDNAARSLAKMGPIAQAAMPALLTTLDDENRYVRFHAALALKQLGTSEARELLFDHLFTSRWCPLTSQGSAY